MKETEAKTPANIPLAIVGMACRFPGAENLDEYWNLIAEGRSALGPLPADRLDAETYLAPGPGVFGKTYSRLGGVVPARPIDPAILPIDEDTMARYDASYLTLCEVVASACRHAGYDPLGLPALATGVYVGNSSGGSELESQLTYHRHASAMAALLHESSGFEKLDPETRSAILSDAVRSVREDFPARSEHLGKRLSPHAAALMIVEVLGLNGPAVVMDAACASSLVALQAAAHALARGTIGMAIVAGAAYRKLYEWVAIAQAGSMSQRGCCPFDQEADGIVCSDGYGAVLVKTVEQAHADGDRILAVVRGIGMSSDGRGKGFWAPRPEGQALAIRRAYESGVDCSQLQYIEAHATSTPLGDATEIKSLTQALGQSLPQKIPVGSVKGNIGHTLESAGMAGLIKAVLAMQHGAIPPAANFRTPNPAMDWDRIPFFVSRQLLDWPATDSFFTRRAGVNSFGIGGLNVHVVIDQTVDQPASPFQPRPELLSASHAKGPPLSNEPLAIVGMSCLLPGADSPESVWQILESGRDPKQPLPPGRWDVQSLLPESSANPPSGGFLTDYHFDWKSFRIPPKQIASANPLQFLMLDAASRALRDAGGEDLAFDRQRVATVAGSILRSDFLIDHWYGVWMADFVARLDRLLRGRGVPPDLRQEMTASYSQELAKRKPAASDDTGSISGSTLAARIAKHFDFMGGAFAVDSADMSAAAALSSASDLLASRSCDVVVCVAGQTSMDVTIFEEYQRSAPSESAWDKSAWDEVPAEGVVCVILKRLSDARRDGDRIRGILHGCQVSASLSAEAARQTVREKIQAESSNAQQKAGLIELADCGPFGVAPPGSKIGPRDSVPLKSLTQPFGDLQGGNPLLMLLRAVLILEQGYVPLKLLAEEGRENAETRMDSHGKPSAVRLLPRGHSLASLNWQSRRGFASQDSGMACQMLIQAGQRLHQEGDADESVACQPTRERGSASMSQNLEHDPDPVPESIVEYDATLPRRERKRQSSQRRDTTADNGSPAEAVPVIEFDATAARRQRLRQNAASPTPVSNAPAKSETPSETALPSESSDHPVPQGSSLPMRRMSRFVMQMLHAPLPKNASKTPAFSGPVLLFGQNATTETLHQKLADQGVISQILHPDPDADSVIEELERLWETGPLPHLFLLTARDETAPIDLKDVDGLSERYHQGVMLPWRICQRWFELVEDANLVEQASLVAATALGGDFGFSGHGPAVEGGGLAGLLKSLHNETRRQLLVKIIDAPRRDPVRLVVAEILGEMAASMPDQEVGYIRGQRKVVRAIRQPAESLPKRQVEPGSVWLVTGGARGVTAEVALELSRRFQLRLHLLGSSPPPNFPPEWRNLSPEERQQLRVQISREALAEGRSPEQAWAGIEKALEIDASLTRFRETGGQAAYHSCDVADPKALAAVLQTIRETDGPIDGIIHGAGQEVAGRFSKKHLANVERVLGAKLFGTLALMALTEPDQPKFFVGFGSTSGRFGGYLQTDYSLANEMLCKMVGSYRDQHPECAAFSIHWTAWDEVGMAARPRGDLILKNLGVERMPVAEGVAVALEEITRQSTHSEILVCDHPGGIHSDQATLPTDRQLEREDECRERLAQSPLVEEMYFASEHEAVAWASLDPTGDPFLLSHQDQGVALFPGVMGVEIAAEAASLMRGGMKLIELKELTLSHRMNLALPKPYRSIAYLNVEGDQARFTLHGEFYGKEGELIDPERQFQSGSLRLGDSPPLIPPPDLGQQPTDWNRVPYPNNWRLRTGNESGTVFYGPALRALKAVHYPPDDSAWGQVIVPPQSEIFGKRPGMAYGHNPAVLDAVLLGCDLLAGHLHNSQQLPCHIEGLIFGRPPREGEHCISRIFYRGEEAGRYAFDFWLLGEEGQVIYQCKFCQFVKINAPTQPARAKPAGSQFA